MRAVILLSLLVFAPSVGFSATIYVPDDYATIQAAIDAASDGDTVIVRPGSYVENLGITGKGITLKSEKGPAVTHLDGNRNANVVAITVTGSTPVTLDGFTIKRGKTYQGGGIYCNDSVVVVTNNVIKYNLVSPSGDGAGIYCTHCPSVVISGNAISRNKADYDPLGMGGSSGGIFATHCDQLTVSDNTIRENYCIDDGCGLRSQYSDAVITGNIIANNIADGWGGDVGFGGGVSFGEGSATIANNIITGNSALGAGGIHLWNATNTVLVNNTIAGNTATFQGGLVCHDSDVEVVNTILWNNSGYEIKLEKWSTSSTLTISHSDLEGGQASVHVETGCSLNWGAGMIDADPLFVDAAIDDYHITFDSPCRSAGDRNAPDLPDKDFEGDPRIAHYLFPDIGADEFYTHFYVNGKVSLGENATGVIVGWPRTSPVVLISGPGLLSTPLSTPYGDLWLMPPWTNEVHFFPIPDNGVRLIPRLVASTLPPGTEISVQALVGTELSNLWTIRIE
jgi:hypothetical protein